MTQKSCSWCNTARWGMTRRQAYGKQFCSKRCLEAYQHWLGERLKPRSWGSWLSTRWISKEDKRHSARNSTAATTTVRSPPGPQGSIATLLWCGRRCEIALQDIKGFRRRKQ